ncbi:hypothetical protein IEQ34_007322 [Dendrobium chrysotoxum]|uniref:Uncharacterized protein n=1 Tax=Dendrobium chrysotoxum TaxID=161865 RepID=A0AAV7H5Z9_DENCH|nr:hypothetical protein IEQ34_007322 [Dendrobium chrysotoxum]
MRNFSSCFSKHSIKLTAAAAPSGNTPTITSIFRARLSSGKPLIIKLTWYKNQADPSLSIGVDDNPDFNNPWKTTSMNSQLLRKKKGTLSFLTCSSSGSLHWDFSAARYQQGPEPTENFYFAIIIDDEIALLLGDKSGEFLKRSNENLPIAEFSLLCRREEVVGRSLNSITRAKFGEAGKDHEISIRCREGGWDGKEAELLVSIDKKRVVHVVKLNWNFRGNETIFVDGLPVDMMWDMHGWWFGSLAGHAVFLFRQRRKLDTRLWLEEKETLGFSLLIQAFRSTF